MRQGCGWVARSARDPVVQHVFSRSMFSLLFCVGGDEKGLTRTKPCRDKPRSAEREGPAKDTGQHVQCLLSCHLSPRKGFWDPGRLLCLYRSQYSSSDVRSIHFPPLGCWAPSVQMIAVWKTAPLQLSPRTAAYPSNGSVL